MDFQRDESENRKKKNEKYIFTHRKEKNNSDRRSGMVCVYALICVVNVLFDLTDQIKSIHST